MSTGQTTQATAFRGNQRPVEQEASHSALLYLLQEVSRLGSPSHSSFLDTNSPIKRLGVASTDVVAETQAEDGHLPPGYDGFPQRSISPFNQAGKAEEERPNSRVMSLTEPRQDGTSPLKVLSLINLQCERILHRSEVEDLHSSPASSKATFGSSTAAADVAGQDAERDEIPASVCDVEDVRGGSIHKDSQLGGSLHVNGQLELNQECKMDFLNGPFSEKDLSQAHVHGCTPFNTQPTLNSNEDDGVDSQKAELAVDCNANVVLTPCDTELSPQLKPSSCCGLSAKLEPELRPVQKEEIAPPPSWQWRTKTRRKQPRPSRSVDIQDPDIQGVRFRMGSELDDSREQCRLLITSKYSKELFKCVRKPRLRSRTSQKSLKTSSSEEESDLMVSKDKVCASCSTRKTPMWRDAEDGTALCNACGIRYKKYRVRCVNCWHIPRKEGNSNSCCLRCGNSVRLTPAQRKHTT